MISENDIPQPVFGPEPFRIGDWRVEPLLHRITSDDEDRRLEPKVMALLLCLASEPGKPWSRQRLLDTAWADVVVGDDALTMAISKLRRALGDSSRAPRYVETIPKQGYRLIPAIKPDLKPVNTSPSPLLTPTRWDRIWMLLGLIVTLLLITSTLLLRRAPEPPRAEPLLDVRLTSHPGAESQAELSPDGEHVVYVRQGLPEAEPGVYLMGLDGRSPRLLIAGSVSSPVWSPDGGRIAFAEHHRDRIDLRIIAPLGGESQTLASAPRCPMAGIDWSQDGRWIVASQPTDDGEACAVFAIEVDTGERIQRTFPPAGHFDARPTYSHDGSLLVFSRGETMFNHDLYVVQTSGETPRRLTTDGQRIWGFDWLISGDALVMASNRNGRFQFWRVPLDGGLPTWLPVPAENVRFPSMTGDDLVFDAYEIGAALWRIDSGAEPKLYPGLGAKSRDSAPQHDPEGQRIAFVSNRSGSAEVWLAGEGEGPRRLTNLGATTITGPRWSPDGRFVVLEALIDNNDSLHILDVEDGTKWDLEGPKEEHLAHPSFSADGSSIYIASIESSLWDLWRVPLYGGAAVKAAEHGVFGLESSDGTTLFFTNAQDGQIWRKPVNGGDATLAIDDLAFEGAANWLLDEETIIYLRRLDDKTELVRRGIQGGAPKVLAPMPPDLLASGLSVSPLDSSILISRYRPIESDIRWISDFR